MKQLLRLLAMSVIVLAGLYAKERVQLDTQGPREVLDRAERGWLAGAGAKATVIAGAHAAAKILKHDPMADLSSDLRLFFYQGIENGLLDGAYGDVDASVRTTIVDALVELAIHKPDSWSADYRLQEAHEAGALSRIYYGLHELGEEDRATLVIYHFPYIPPGEAIPHLSRIATGPRFMDAGTATLFLSEMGDAGADELRNLDAEGRLNPEVRLDIKHGGVFVEACQNVPDLTPCVENRILGYRRGHPNVRGVCDEAVDQEACDTEFRRQMHECADWVRGNTSSYASPAARDCHDDVLIRFRLRPGG